MSDFDLEDLVNPVVDSGRSRKRQRNSDNWDKNKRKHARNSSSAHSKPRISCNHVNSESKTCKAVLLDNDDIDDFYNKLYSFKTKVDQDNFLLKYMMPVEPKRHRPRVEDPRTKLLTKYFIRKKSGNLVCVCAKSFSSLTQIGRYRLNGISKSFNSTGEPRVEKRGGSRLKAKDIGIQTSIIRHIQSIRCRESHYGRTKSARLYMSPDLSIKKLWRLWKTAQIESDMPTASFSKYFKIFQTKFNIGFGTPKTDMCSFCEQLKIKVKNSQSPREKSELIAQHRLHKLRAKKFYSMLKETPEGSVTVAFDMQQNQPLPMLRVSETFYSRQIWLYNLTFVIHEKTQDVNNTFMYTWTENQAAKGSNEVVSALHNFLGILEERIRSKAEDDNINLPMTLNLFSDAASSQNKNSTMLGYLLSYVQKSTVFNEVNHIFPIRGHSFMPPDRIFGRIEKDYRKMQTILLPNEYHNILKQHGTLKILSDDWKILDFKKCADNVLMKKLPFLMREQRIFKFRKGFSKIYVKNTYTGHFNEHKIIKNTVNKTWKTLYERVNIVNEVNKISQLKKNDVEKLLQFVNLPEDVNNFYSQALMNAEENQNIRDFTETTYDEEEPFL